jgi:RNA polymerase sigma-70 factor, ECF subfamily
LATQANFLQQFLAIEADLRALVGCFVRARQDREDVFQDAALTLWDKFGQRGPDEPFAPWARGVAMNKIRQYWDRQGRAPLPFSPQAVEAIVEAFNRRDEPAPVALDVLEKCLEAIPEKSRRLLGMRYAEALSVGDIAARSGVAAAGIYKALARLRERLEDCVRRRLPGMQGS